MFSATLGSGQLPSSTATVVRVEAAGQYMNPLGPVYLVPVVDNPETAFSVNNSVCAVCGWGDSRFALGIRPMRTLCGHLTHEDCGSNYRRYPRTTEEPGRGFSQGRVPCCPDPTCFRALGIPALARCTVTSHRTQTCGVCLQVLSDNLHCGGDGGVISLGESPLRTPCDHFFHLVCLSAAVRAQNGQPSCPSCRGELLSVRASSAVGVNDLGNIREPSPMPSWWGLESDDEWESVYSDYLRSDLDSPPPLAAKSDSDGDEALEPARAVEHLPPSHLGRTGGITSSYPSVASLDEPSGVVSCVSCGEGVGDLDFQLPCVSGHVRHLRCVPNSRSVCPACAQDLSAEPPRRGPPADAPPIVLGAGLPQSRESLPDPTVEEPLLYFDPVRRGLFALEPPAPSGSVPGGGTVNASGRCLGTSQPSDSSVNEPLCSVCGGAFHPRQDIYRCTGGVHWFHGRCLRDANHVGPCPLCSNNL
jgi:hypothetical protein